MERFKQLHLEDTLHNGGEKNITCTICLQTSLNMTKIFSINIRLIFSSSSFWNGDTIQCYQPYPGLTLYIFLNIGLTSWNDSELRLFGPLLQKHHKFCDWSVDCWIHDRFRPDRKSWEINSIWWEAECSFHGSPDHYIKKLQITKLILAFVHGRHAIPNRTPLIPPDSLL